MLHVTTDQHQFDPAHIVPKDIRVKDVVQSLPMICRYNGFVSRFYSVAQHLVLACELAELDNRSLWVRKAVLLHDAQEAWLGDVTTPVKECIPGYRELEWTAFVAVCEAFDMPAHNEWLWEQVKYYDRMACHMEGKYLMLHKYDWVQEVPSRYWETNQGWNLKVGFECSPALARTVFTNKLAEYGLC